MCAGKIVHIHGSKYYVTGLDGSNRRPATSDDIAWVKQQQELSKIEEQRADDCHFNLDKAADATRLGRVGLLMKRYAIWDVFKRIAT